MARKVAWQVMQASHILFEARGIVMPDEPRATPAVQIRDPLAEIDELQELYMQLQERVVKLEMAGAADAAKASKR